MGMLEVFIWGLLGGVGAELAVVFQLRHQLRVGHHYWLRSPVYWLIVAAMVGFAGVMVVAHARSGTVLNPLIAIQLGASTPLLLRKFREAVPESRTPPDPSKVD